MRSPRSHDYDAGLVPLAKAGKTGEEIFWELAVEDIQKAADLLRPLYDESNKEDGYVSLEVNPYLAHDTAQTLSEAKRLWKWVNRPNLMVKIPATVEGLPAIMQAIEAGINVNVTLIFSRERHWAVMEMYISGLARRAAKGLPIDSIASVASFFVSRVDTKVDGHPERHDRPRRRPGREGSPIPGPGRDRECPAGLQRLQDHLRLGALRQAPGPGRHACSARCGPPPAPRTRRTAT